MKNLPAKPADDAVSIAGVHKAPTVLKSLEVLYFENIKVKIFIFVNYLVFLKD